MKFDITGYNWPFLTIFDFAIIFHLKNYLLGVIIFSTTSHLCIRFKNLQSYM